MLGKLIHNIREEYGITPNELSQGLCSEKMLYKYETQEEEPEKLLADALFQRLGKSVDKYDILLDLYEYQMAEARCRIQVRIHRGEIKEAEQELSAYERIYIEKNHLHKQFTLLMRAELGRRNMIPVEEQKKMVVEGLSMTVREFAPEKIPQPEIMRSRYFSLMELFLLVRYAFLEEKSGKAENAFLWYREMKNYLEPEAQPEGMYKIKVYDNQDRNKVLPFLLYCQAELFAKEKHDKAALQQLESACTLLSAARNQAPLFVKALEKKFAMQRECGEAVCPEEENQLAQWMGTLGEQEKIWREDWYPLYEEQYIASVNRVIRERRTAQKIEPEDLAVEICDVRTLKNAEAEKSKLQREKRDRLLERLNVSNLKYDGGIVTARYSDYKKFGSMRLALGLGNYEEAWELYQQLEHRAGKDCVTNWQFKKHWGTVIKHRMGKMRKEECCRELWKILEESCRVDNAVRCGDCTLMEHEREALSHLAWYDSGTYQRELRELLWKQYEKLGNSDSKYFYCNYYLGILHRLSKILRRNNEYELAEQIIGTAREEQAFLHEDTNWACILVGEFFLGQDKQEEGIAKPGEDIFTWLRSSYAVSKLYLKDEKFAGNIVSYVIKKYGEENKILDGLLLQD